MVLNTVAIQAVPLLLFAEHEASSLWQQAAAKHPMEQEQIAFPSDPCKMCGEEDF